MKHVLYNFHTLAFLSNLGHRLQAGPSFGGSGGRASETFSSESRVGRRSSIRSEAIFSRHGDAQIEWVSWPGMWKRLTASSLVGGIATRIWIAKWRRKRWKGPENRLVFHRVWLSVQLSKATKISASMDWKKKSHFFSLAVITRTRKFLFASNRLDFLSSTLRCIRFSSQSRFVWSSMMFESVYPILGMSCKKLWLHGVGLRGHCY